VEWCLKSPRVNRGRQGSHMGILLAVCLLAAVAVGKIAMELHGRDPNHFVTLGVRVDAPVAEIKKAYKAASIKYHPDKSDDPNAHAKFMKVSSAYEVLKDASSRDAYNKFGAKSSDKETSLTSIAIFYVIWLVVGYLLTMGKGSEDARTWAFSGLLALAVFEYQTRILSSDYLAPIFPYSTVDEKLELLHKLFPPFLHGSRMISSVIFRDVGLYNKMLLDQMHLKVDLLGRQVLSTRREIEARSEAGGGATAAPLAANAAASGLNTTGGQPSDAMREATDAWAALLQPEPSAQAASAPAAEGAPAADSTGQAGGATAAVPGLASAANQNRLMNIVWFFVVYAGFKYVVDKD